eukprot:ANDGO_07553.mRNA.1 Exportin-4
MDFQATQLQFEEASRGAAVQSSSRESFERYLLEWRHARRADSFCRHILENSQVPEALFHAALTLNSCIVREWPLFSSSEKQELKQFLIMYLLQRSALVPSFVKSQVYRVLSVMIKRSWFEESAEAKNGFFMQLMSALSGSDIQTRNVALGVWNSLIDEFSFRGASALGLSLEFHEQCRFSFQEGCLLPLFVALAELLSAAVQPTNPGTVDSSADVIASYVNLMSNILQWEFIENTQKAAYLRMRDRGSTYASASTALTANAVVRPPQSWRAALVNAKTVYALWSAHQILFSSPKHAEMPSHRVREAIFQMCSVRDDFFTQESSLSFATMYVELALSLGALFFGYAKANADSDVCGSLLYDSAFLLRKTFTHFRINKSMLNLLGSVRDFAVQLVNFRLTDQTYVDDSVIGDALELILEAWGEIVASYMNVHYQTHRSVLNEDLYQQLRTTLPTYCGDVSKSYLMMQLSLGRKEVLELLGVTQRKQDSSRREKECDVKDEEEDAEEYVIEDRLSSVAILARLDPAGIFTWLDQAFGQVTTSLLRFSEMKVEDSTELVLSQEDLYWCIMFAGHIFADDCDGETPSLSDSFVSWASQIPASEAATCPMFSVFARIRQLAEWEFCGHCNGLSFSAQAPPNPFVLNYISPRISEGLSWFFARWIPTYLHVDFDEIMTSSVSRESLQSSVLSLFTASSPYSFELVNCLLVRLLFCLQTMPMEPAIMDAQCSLLQRCASNSSIAPVIVRLPLFWSIVDNVASSRDAHTLEVQRQLYRAFVEMCSSTGSIEETQQALQRCLAPLRQLVETAIFGALGVQADGTFSVVPSVETIARKKAVVCIGLERLRGVCRGFNMFPRLQAYLPLLAGPLFRLYRDDTMVLSSISRFFKDFCDVQVGFLEPQEYMYTCKIVLSLLQTARDCGVGTRKSKDDTADDDVMILTSFVEILSHLSSKFYFDGSSSGNISDAEVEAVEKASTDVLFEGFALLIPVLRSSNRLLFEHLDLSSRFFELLNQTLDVHTDKLASISTGLFSALVDTVHNALNVPSKLIVSNSLDAWYALLKHHIQQGSLAPQLEYNPLLFEQSMSVLMRWAMFDDLDAYLVKSLSQCILALMVCNQTAFQRFAETMVSQEQSSPYRDRMLGAFQRIASVSGFRLSIDKDSREKFGSVFAGFMEEVRAFVRTN